MDHMRNSGNNPRQWSLAKQSILKVENGDLRAMTHRLALTIYRALQTHTK